MIDVRDWPLAEKEQLLTFLRWNSYRSEQYKLLYVSTPKVACTSLKWWFAALEGYSQALQDISDSVESDPDLVVHESHKVAPHVTGLPTEELLPALTSEAYFRFAVVRNPFKRIFSAWQSKILLHEPLQITRYANFDFYRLPVDNEGDIALSFERFLEHLARYEAPSYWDHHWTPQAQLLRPDLIDYSELIQLENAKTLGASLSAWLGRHVRDPFADRRKNESLIPFLPNLITERSAELIRELYAADFDLFGYDRELPDATESFPPEKMELAVKAIKLVRARHRRLAERAAAIAGRDSEIASLKRDSKDTEGRIKDREARIARLNNLIARYELRIEKQQQLLTEREGEISRLRAQKGNEIKLAQLKLDQILSSRSWRTTEPLRKGARFVSRLNKSSIMRSIWRISGVTRLRSRLEDSRTFHLVRSSSYFDKEYYVSENPDVIGTGIEPVIHYVRYGWKESRNPSALFSSDDYISSNPDVGRIGMNPLVHYLKYGQKEGRPISPRTVIGKGRKGAVKSGLGGNSLVAGRTPQVHSRGEGVRARVPIDESEVRAIQESGLFDAMFYTAMYRDLELSPQDAIRHYCDVGWREGRNPSDDFNTRFYLTTYDDIRVAGVNPFWHYVVAGAKEGRSCVPEALSGSEDDIWFGNAQTDIRMLAFYVTPDWSALEGVRPLFKGHTPPEPSIDGRRHYDPLDPSVLKDQARLARHHGIYGFCFELHAGADHYDRQQPIDIVLANPDINVQLCAEVVLSADDAVSPLAKRIKRVVSDRRQITVGERPLIVVRLPGDLSRAIDLMRSFNRQLSAEGINRPFTLVRRMCGNAVTETPGLLAELCDGELDLPVTPGNDAFGSYIPVEKNGASVVPYGVVVSNRVACTGRVASGGRPFFHVVTVGRDSSASKSSRPIVYSRFNSADYRRWLDAVIDSTRKAHVPNHRLVFLDAWNGWADGSFVEPDKRSGFTRLNETTRALLGYEQGQAMPKVSVIVPNYKHEPFLRRRLDSIYGQTYKNIEVLLLDDCSPDNSRDVMDEYAVAFPEITRTLYNGQNSGSAFRQWSKGIQAAKGDLIWIAESDDFCDERFLEVLVRCFDDEAVLLAYGHSVFVDREERPIEDAFKQYVSDLDDAERWNGDYDETTHNEVKRALGIKNTIPNASGAIFRRPIDMPLLRDESWLSMAVAGDWVFYLHILRGGKIAYRNNAINFFRRYQGSTAEVTYKNEVFYREVGLASRTVAALYDVPLEVLELCRKGYEDFYWQKVGIDDEEFLRWYNYEAVVEARHARLPNIMISTMGFSPGGAEILPIRLANEFKRCGLSVVLLSTGLLAHEDKIRCMLRNDVPVIETSDVSMTREVIREFGIEVLNTHQWHTQKYPLYIPDVFDGLRGHVASLHGMIEHGAFGATSEQLREVDQKVTTWVYTAEKNIAPFAEAGLYEHASSRFVKIPNGMMPPTVAAVARDQMGIPSDAFVLCCVSRAIPDKGWAETIRAVERARELSGRDIRLILVGNGPVYDEYCHVGAPDFVYLAGFSENSVGFYAAADMGIMLTKFRSESFPLTIVDCLFAGKPYISSDVGEIRNMLTEDDKIAGAIIRLEDWEIPIDVAAHVIASFASERDRYQGAQELVSSLANRYRIDMVAAKYIELFRASRHQNRLWAQSTYA